MVKKECGGGREGERERGVLMAVHRRGEYNCDLIFYVRPDAGISNRFFSSGYHIGQIAMQ